MDEYDFTRKYGIAYMFSNGLIGVLFNDKTSVSTFPRLEG